MRYIIIGDAHGMKTEIVTLFRTLRLTADDRIILAGDLLDKGPDSAGVVRVCRTLRQSGMDVVLVAGNHEEKHARRRKGSMVIGSAEIDAITSELDAMDIEFLESAVLSYTIEEHGIVVIHAGVTPHLKEIPTTTVGMTRAEREDAEQVLRVRFLDKETHKAIGKADEGSDDVFWADIYDGRFGHIVFGHHPFTGETEPKRFPFATGVDLGAVMGGHLCALIIEEDGTSSHVTVKASGVFHTRKS